MPTSPDSWVGLGRRGTDQNSEGRAKYNIFIFVMFLFLMIIQRMRLNITEARRVSNERIE